jgi:NAD(P)-dependent dehydrogenase (short-subunit alcohol dehydrogenase family)
MEALKGKVAVVTGGSSGIGLATATRFVAEGAFVFITGRPQAELDKAAKEIGRNVVAVKCDVSRLEDLDHLYKEVAARKSTIDIVFENAGMVENVETPAATPEHFDRTFNANARGAYFTVQTALPLLNLDHIDGFRRMAEGSAGLQDLRRYQSRHPFRRSDLDGRVRTSRNPRKRNQPGTNRNAHV